MLEDLPLEIPIFPLRGAVILPGGYIPLNVFEPRYVNMVLDSLRTPTRLIGIIQPRAEPEEGDRLGEHSADGSGQPRQQTAKP
jgi:Lon protease-like protein